MAKHFDLKRSKPSKKPKSLVVLFCEGEKTEPVYFRAINRHWGNRIVLQFPHCGTDPKGIVSAAADAKKRSKRNKKSDPNEEIEAIWCVFDRDQHLLVQEALQQADDNQIPVAFSNPCFELWLLLHFQDQTAHLQRDGVSRLCANFMTNYTKGPDMDMLLPSLSDAEQRARTLCNRQTTNNLPRCNPWTDVHELVEAMRRLSDSQPI